MRALLAVLVALLPVASAAEEAANAPAGEVRVLDKITGTVTDLTLQAGETAILGQISVTLGECRYPVANPTGDAWMQIVVRPSQGGDPVFSGWMIASAPALVAMDHPRYDVWALRCITS